MMLELAPERTFGVLSPSFRGNEAEYALRIFSHNSCTFLHDERCELFGTGLQPLECRFCHHLRKGKGSTCHRALEEEWKSDRAKRLVMRWATEMGLLQRMGNHVVTAEG